MTRKDFRLIAEVLRQERPDAADVDPFARDKWASGTYDEWSTVVIRMARALRDDSGYDLNGNRRFDIDRFYAAAGFRP
jgi:hypothetical protein